MASCARERSAGQRLIVMTLGLNPSTIVAIMGGDVTGRHTCNVPGPGHSKHDRSLSIKITSSDFIVFSHANDDWKECRDYVCSKLGLGDDWHREKRQAPVVTAADDQERKKTLALKIWSEARDPRGTIVEHYLREHRGLALPDSVAGSVIRFHPALFFDAYTRHFGMVCLFRDIKSNEPCGIHRTFLDRQTGTKVDRKMLGIAKGAAIKFDAEPSMTLTIGEGTETVLAARDAGFAPAWALGSSGAVRCFPVLQQLRELTILQENDATSRRDVKSTARRYLELQRPVNIVEPRIGNDFNDCWRERK
jgi:putative DNA primase/helicase